MTRRTLLGRLLSPAGFGLVLLFFLLPFASVSCQTGSSEVRSTFTGVDLVVGGAPEVTGTRSEPEADEAELAIVTGFQDQLDLEPLALLAALAVLAGMAAAMIKGWAARHAAGAGLAVISVGLLAAAQVRVVDRLNDAIRSTVDPGERLPGVVENRYGFWLAAALLVLLAAGHAVGFLRLRRAVAAPDGGGPDPAEVDAAPAGNG